MKFIRFGLIFIAVVTISAANAAAQKVLLLPDQVTEKSIKGGDSHVFEVDVKQDELFSVAVTGKNDVYVGLYDKDSKMLAQSDDVVAGTENLFYFAARTERATLMINAIDDKAAAQNYTIKVYKKFDLPQTEQKSLAIGLMNVGLKFYNDKDYAVALKFYERALTILKTLPVSYERGKVNELLAQDYAALDDKLKAIEFYRAAVDVFTELKQEKNAAIIMNNIGGVYFQLKKYGDGVVIFQKAHTIFHNLKEYQRAATSILQAGDGWMVLDGHEFALIAFQYGVDVGKHLEDETLEMYSLGRLGTAYDKQGDYDKALECYESEYKLAVKQKSKPSQADAKQKIGALYFSKGAYSASLENSEAALKLYRDVPDEAGESGTLNNIGIVYRNIGTYDKAIENLTKAAEIAARIKDEEGEMIALTNLGWVYHRVGRTAEAFKIYENALPRLKALSEASISQESYVSTLNKYGVMLREAGQIAKSIEVHQLALKRSQVNVYPFYEVRAARELAGDYLAAKDLPNAVKYYSEALKISRRIKARWDEAAALTGLMTTFKRQNQLALAVFYGKQAVNLYQVTRADIKSFGKASQDGFVKSNEETYRILADLLIENGRLPEAQQVLDMLKEEEAAEFVKRDGKEMEALSKRADLSPDEKTALEKYLILADDAAKIGAEFAALEKTKNRLGVDEKFAEQTRYDELKTQVETANKAFAIFVEKELVNELSKEKKAQLEQDSALQGNLQKWGAGTVALSTVVGADRYRVILTTPKIQIAAKYDITAAELNAKIQAFRVALRNPAIDPRPLGEELYNILIKPIEKDLANAGAKTLVWSLDGALRYIPIPALWDGEKYLVEKYQNVLVTSTTRQSLLAPVEKDWRALGAGVTKQSSIKLNAETVAFEGLPSVGKELGMIVNNGAPNNAGLLTGASMIDGEFTVDALKNLLGKTDDEDNRLYNVVHFATHFRLGSDMTNSFLLLGGNQVLTLETVQISPEINFNDVELVTLSACNTGMAQTLGKDATGKEVNSLAQFIESRGAKAVMATLWSVADESTQLVMSEFYRIRKENPKLTKAGAMQTAQAAMLKGKLKPTTPESLQRAESATRGSLTLGGNKGGGKKFVFDPAKPYAHPYFWSPFILIGNWR